METLRYSATSFNSLAASKTNKKRNGQTNYECGSKSLLLCCWIRCFPFISNKASSCTFFICLYTCKRVRTLSRYRYFLKDGHFISLIFSEKTFCCVSISKTVRRLLQSFERCIQPYIQRFRPQGTLQWKILLDRITSVHVGSERVDMRLEQVELL